LPKFTKGKANKRSICVLFPESTKQMISGKMILVLGESLYKRKKCGSLVKVKDMSLARGGLLSMRQIFSLN
jgi:hypothetical protein